MWCFPNLFFCRHLIDVCVLSWVVDMRCLFPSGHHLQHLYDGLRFRDQFWIEIIYLLSLCPMNHRLFVNSEGEPIYFIWGQKLRIDLLVMPSVMISVILQQEDSILMLSWSTIKAYREKQRAEIMREKRSLLQNRKVCCLCLCRQCENVFINIGTKINMHVVWYRQSRMDEIVWA